MTTRTLRATGPATAEVAWERYARPAQWPTWAPQIRAVRTPGERIAPGLAGRVVGPLGISVRFVVESVDEARRRWVWRVRLGPLRLRLHHGVRAHERGGVTTDLRIEGPLPAVVLYAVPARLALRRLVRR